MLLYYVGPSPNLVAIPMTYMEMVQSKLRHFCLPKIVFGIHSGRGHEIVQIPDQKSDHVILTLCHLHTSITLFWAYLSNHPMADVSLISYTKNGRTVFF